MKILFVIAGMLLFSNTFAADFTNESEAGIAVASGNTDSKTYNIKQMNSYKFDANLLKLEARFLNTFSNDVESARYILGSLRYERALSEHFSLFVSEGLESDKFAGYKFRHNNDIGAKYFIYKIENFNWFAEAGYRYVNEKLNSGVHDYKNTLRAYTETEKKWTETVSTKYFIEYLPNLKEGKDYQINTELSVAAAISSIFSIKTAYLLRYDHLPAPGTTNTTDTLLTTALVAKF